MFGHSCFDGLGLDRDSTHLELTIASDIRASRTSHTFIYSDSFSLKPPEPLYPVIGLCKAPYTSSSSSSLLLLSLLLLLLQCIDESSCSDINDFDDFRRDMQAFLSARAYTESLRLCAILIHSCTIISDSDIFNYQVLDLM